MGGDCVHLDLRRPDAGVRTRRRHAGLSPHLPDRQPLERRRLRAVRIGVELSGAARRARDARHRRGPGAELRTGTRHQPASRIAPHAHPRHLHDGDRSRRRAGSADRRPARAADRLARRVLVPRAARPLGVPAGMAAAARHAPGASRAVRCGRRCAAGARDQRHAARAQPDAGTSATAPGCSSSPPSPAPRRPRASSRRSGGRSGRSSTCASSAMPISRC